MISWSIFTIKTPRCYISRFQTRALKLVAVWAEFIFSHRLVVKINQTKLEEWFSWKSQFHFFLALAEAICRHISLCSWFFLPTLTKRTIVSNINRRSSLSFHWHQRHVGLSTPRSWATKGTLVGGNLEFIQVQAFRMIACVARGLGVNPSASQWFFSPRA